MKKIVDASRLTTVSSEGFLEFLPKSRENIELFIVITWYY